MCRLLSPVEPRILSAMDAVCAGSGRAYMPEVFARVDQRVDDGGTVLPACVLDGLFELGQPRHPPAPGAERRRRRGKIDRPVTDAVIGVPAPLLRDLNQ